MTDEQKAKYMAKPVRCPFCKSLQIEAGGTVRESFDDEISHVLIEDVACLNCHAEWKDKYTLTLTAVTVTKRPAKKHTSKKSTATA